MTMEVEPQTLAAQRMYDPRASTYDDSWHPDYSERFSALLPLSPGDKVLDLACGTGLDAFMAADAVGSEGEVVAIDVSPAMLTQADSKLSITPCPVKLLQHDVTDLVSLRDIEGAEFDAVICSNAMVMFDDPAAVVRGWRPFVRPGGFLAVDVTHERESVAGPVIERVVKRMGVEYPIPRSWLHSQDTLREILEAEGFEVEREVELDKVVGNRSSFLLAEQADAQFDYITMRSRNIANKEFMDEARKLFREEWAREAVGGQVEIVNAMYVYIARRKD